MPSLSRGTINRRQATPKLANAMRNMDLNRVHQLKSQILLALAHPTRIAILEVLREGEMSVGELCDRLGIEQANCSQHLSILRAKDIVHRRRSANLSYYSVGDRSAARLLDDLNEFIRSQVSHSVDILAGIVSLAKKTKR